MGNVEEIIAQQKRDADELLDKLYLIDPTCIVAGGAPRDWYFGIPATDIDLFVYIPDGRTTKLIQNLLEKAGLVISSAKNGESLLANYKRNPYLRVVFNVEGFSCPVQIMIMRELTFKSAVPTFPLSICRTWYKDKVIRCTKDFAYSVENKCILYTNELYNDEDKYIAKIEKKFKDFEIISREDSKAVLQLLISGHYKVDPNLYDSWSKCCIKSYEEQTGGV